MLVTRHVLPVHPSLLTWLTSMSCDLSGLVLDDPVIWGNVGRAYREQAITLIEICRLFVGVIPQTYTEHDYLQKWGPFITFRACPPHSTPR
jgi:hypothetical protein